MAWYYEWRPYVPVAERRRQAMRKMAALRKKGVDVQPVKIEGRKIAKTFWGEAWCEHLEAFSDFENRLPRGRTYVRNGSVCHLTVAQGKVEARVSGSELYKVDVTIKTLPAKKWMAIKDRCAGQIGSLLDLLAGRLSGGVMEVVTDRQNGLFPLPGEMSFRCSCPDWASMCKHVAAVLYGVGSRLDEKPELLFLLRGVDHEELISADAEKAVAAATTRGKAKRLAKADLGEVFGIELDGAEVPEAPAGGNGADKRPRAGRATKKTAKKAAKKTVKKAAKKTAKKAGRRGKAPEPNAP